MRYRHSVIGRAAAMTGWLLATCASGWPISTAAQDGPAVPRVFSPGVISSAAHDSAPAFSPDGRDVYFTRSTPAASVILVAHRTRLGWSAPAVAPFSGIWLDMEPALAPDGSYMIFVSNRPARAGDSPIDGLANGKPQPGKGGNLWRTDRLANGWGTPRRLPDTINSGGAIYAPGVAGDGTLYFMKPASASGRFQLYSARPLPGGYDVPRPLAFSDGSTTDVDPAVAPDQSFVIFGSARAPANGIDLFVAYRSGAGWGVPIHLGNVVNSPTSDAEPRLSPDGRTLYFSSERLAPVAAPIGRGEAVRVVAEMSEWNNGLYNIWHVDLLPLLHSHRR